MPWVADLIYFLVGSVYLPVAVYNAVILRKNRRGWRQRFGFMPQFCWKPLDQPRPGCGQTVPRGRIWIHAVSLGEINATPKLVEELRRRLPGHDFVFSSTTDTGFARAVQLYGAEKVFRFPLDFSFVISRVLRRVAPTMIVLVELEVWPNLTRMAARRGIPVVVVNGRLTERSARRFSWLGRPVRSMFADLTWVGAQDEMIAARFRQLGVAAERVEVTSSLKWDTAQIADHVDGDEALARALGIDGSRPLWVCGSTGPGEEQMNLDAYRGLLEVSDEESEPGAQATGPESNEATKRRSDEGKAPLLCIVPRKPERFAEVAALIERAGFRCIRRSQRPDGAISLPSGGADVILGDSMGELRKFYSLASVIFVGRSLVPMGGSDPMEAAALGKPIIVGPHMENFQEPVEALRRADALRLVHHSDELATAIQGLLADSSLVHSLGSRAQKVVHQHQGATQKTTSRLMHLMQRG